MVHARKDVMDNMTAYVVLAFNDDNKVQIFGSRTGRAFGSYVAAERVARDMGFKYSDRLEFLVMEIQPTDAAIRIDG
jgi:hypothetical protein